MRYLTLAICLFLGACGGEAQPPLLASDVVITAPMPGMQMSAAYLAFRNTSDDAIRITRIVSPQFSAVEIHESVLEDGIAKMRRIEVLTIPPNSSVTLQHGGKHLMLMRPSGTLATVSLSFYDGDTLLLNVSAAITSRSD